jgi:sugar phosphate isomerase/epimerase
MYLTGIADEAGASLEAQIKATKELGWKNLEARVVEVPGFPAGNIHDLPDAAFDALVDRVTQAGITISGFGSTIANWAKRIDQPGDSSLAEARRAIPRMQRLGTKIVRIMSFALLDGEDQMEAERFRRLREITRMFLDAGLQPAHENDSNYGGMGWPFSLKLLENVPGLKLLFDTGNPVFHADRSKPKPWPMQDSWEFYSHVRDHVIHVHVKDAVWAPAKNNADYKFPGEGDGRVRKILQDLLARGYDGGISIEPHMAVVFHDKSVKASPEAQYENYVEYGRRLGKLVEEAKAELILNQKI